MCLEKTLRFAKNRGAVVTAIFIFLFVAPVLLANVQMIPGNTVDFTPADQNPGTTKTWTMPFWLWTNDGTWRTQFASTVYTYNDNYGNRYRKIAPMAIETGAGIGGVVWHFQSSSVGPMTLKITPTHFLGGTGQRNFDVYYSDVNDWGSISPMVGGTWTAKETKSSWVNLFSDRKDGGTATAAGDLGITTEDGNFWVRIDMASTDGGGETYVALSALSVQGTVVDRFPEVCTVPSIQALRALVPLNGDGAMVMGYYSVQDGGEGFFYYDAASTGTDNGGTIIAPYSGNGRWLRSSKGQLNVKHFGAKGDGVADDTTAIRNTVLYAYQNGFIPVFFPAGTYKISDTIYMTNQEFSAAAPNIIGAGAAVTTIEADASFPAGGCLFDYKGGSGAVTYNQIEKVQIKGTGRTGTVVGVRVRDLDGLVISECKFSDLRYGIRLHNEDGFAEFDTAQNCEFEEVGTTLHFYRTGGWGSFNSSGLLNCKTNAYGTTPVIEIEDVSGNASDPALPYNSPMDFSVIASNPGAVIFGSNLANYYTIYGNIRIEGEDVSMTTGNGQWWSTGSISVRGNDVILGRFRPRRVLTSYTTGPFAGETHTWQAPTRQVYTLQSGKTVLTESSVAEDVSALFYVSIVASNYNYRYLLNVTHDGGGGNGYVNIVAAITQDNGTGAGAPSFSVNSVGELEITNVNYSSSYSAEVFKTPIGAEAYPAAN
jgi:hypothetical protein